MKSPASEPSTVLTTVIIKTAMPAAIRPYSMAVTPDSSSYKTLHQVDHELLVFHALFGLCPNREGLLPTFDPELTPSYRAPIAAKLISIVENIDMLPNNCMHEKKSRPGGCRAGQVHFANQCVGSGEPTAGPYSHDCRLKTFSRLCFRRKMGTGR